MNIQDQLKDPTFYVWEDDDVEDRCKDNQHAILGGIFSEKPTHKYGLKWVQF